MMDGTLRHIAALPALESLTLAANSTPYVYFHGSTVQMTGAGVRHLSALTSLTSLTIKALAGGRCLPLHLTPALHCTHYSLSTPPHIHTRTADHVG